MPVNGIPNVHVCAGSTWDISFPSCLQQLGWAVPACLPVSTRPDLPAPSFYHSSMGLTGPFLAWDWTLLRDSSPMSLRQGHLYKDSLRGQEGS